MRIELLLTVNSSYTNISDSVVTHLSMYTIKYDHPLPQIQYSANDSETANFTSVSYLLEQNNHGGGDCFCVDVNFDSSYCSGSSQSTLGSYSIS